MRHALPLDVVEFVAVKLCEIQQPKGAWDRKRDNVESYRNIFRNEAEQILTALVTEYPYITLTDSNDT